MFKNDADAKASGEVDEESAGTFEIVGEGVWLVLLLDVVNTPNGRN